MPEYQQFENPHAANEAARAERGNATTFGLAVRFENPPKNRYAKQSRAAVPLAICAQLDRQWASQQPAIESEIEEAIER